MSRTEALAGRTRARSRVPAARSPEAGLMLAAALVGWTWLSALRSGGRAGPLAALCLACAAAWAAGFLAAGTPAGTAAPRLVAAAGIAALATPGFWAELRSPLGPPLGYANANAALFVQAEVAALLLLALSARRWQRVATGVLAGAFALVPVLIGSVAATILAVGVAAAAALRRARWVPAACALCLALAFATTLAVGAAGAARGPEAGDRADGLGAAPGAELGASDRVPRATVGQGTAVGAETGARDRGSGNEPPSAEAGVHLPTAVERLVEGNRRAVLWGEAFSIMAHRPLWGAGPQRFRETAPTALADPDAAWAHNAFLQQGAETGIPGLVLLAALFAWALAQTAGMPAAGRSTRDPALGGEARAAGTTRTAETPGTAGPMGAAGTARTAETVGAAGAVGAIGSAGVAALGMHATVDYVLHFAAVPVAGALLAGFAAGHVRSARRMGPPEPARRGGHTPAPEVGVR